MKSVRFSLLFALAGCLPGTFPSLPPDQDGDGYTVGDLDCDDTNAAVNPATVWFEDVDGDGHGDPASSVTQCETPSGYVLSNLDCDDSNPDIRPEAVETCDGVDEDCDGVADNGAPGSDKYYTDADADGFGDDATETVSCTVLPDHVSVGGDCDDSNKEANPDAIEVCDGTDNDCNTLTDDEPTDGTKWFVDADEDGVGGTEFDTFCDDPGVGYAPTSDDCDDGDKTVGKFRLWYGDLDKDGYGDDLAEAKACTVPVDHVAKGGDCVDTDKTIHPSADELCDGVDQDCDTNIDDNPVDPTAWYLDADDDTYGAGTPTSACTAPTNKYVDQAGDCKDFDPAYHPGAPETCTDTVDFNCDGSIGLVDNDGDGFAACVECNDNNIAINPGATEICDAANVDENCNLLADDADSGVSNATRSNWYYDGDADTYGLTSNVKRACDRPVDYVVASGDCNDLVGTVNPGAPEVCDVANTDEDCDGNADDLDTAPSGRTAFYADVDLDGHGDATDVLDLCDAAGGRVVSLDDCNDTKANIHPGATEVCDAANVDENCLNAADDLDPNVSDASRTNWYFDGDGDTYGLTSNSLRKCDAPTDYVVAPGDCNDVLGTINPGVAEVCDSLNVDEDCDGAADDLDTSATNKAPYFRDVDGDGFGNASDSVSLCDVVAGRVVNSTDCSDANANLHPGAPELCDGVVDDCSGGWVLADENGVVTHFPTTGTANDLTAAWAAGAKNSIVSLTLPTSGSVSVCAGTYYVALTAPSGMLTLSGAAPATTILDGEGGTSRLLTVSAPATVRVFNLTLTNGAGGAHILGDAEFTNTRFIANAASLGGGLAIETGGVLALYSSLVDQNTATDGGGIWAVNAAYVDLNETIVSNNTATTNGGGVFADTTPVSCTAAGVGGVFTNTAGGGVNSGGGVFQTGTLDLSSSACDWGVSGVDDNSPDDIVFDGTGVVGSYGASASFVCTGTSCN